LKIIELLENVRQWKEHPVVKINYLFKFFNITDDLNVKSVIVDEILDDIDSVMLEFPVGNPANTHLQQIKTTLTTYKNGQ
jgi:hypothetical protein